MIFRKIIFMFVLVLFTFNPLTAAKKAPVVKDGVIDISDWNFDRDGELKVKGDWEFYWNKLYTPKDFKQDNLPAMSGYYGFPKKWNKNKVGETQISPFGYTTYRMHIKSSGKKQYLTLKIPELLSSFKLYINGRGRATWGKTGKSKGTSLPRRGDAYIKFLNKTKMTEVIMQQANYHRRDGGSWAQMSLSASKESKKGLVFTYLTDGLLIGAILIMAIYHFTLYLLRHEDKSSLAFAAFCLSTVLRTSYSGEGELAFTYFPWINWEWAIRFEYLGFFFMTVTCFWFTDTLYKEQISKYVRWIVYPASALYILLGFLAPTLFFTKIVGAYHLIWLIMCISIIVAPIIGIRKKILGSWTFLTGLIILFLANLNDMLISRALIQSVSLGQFGLFVFIFAQSFLLSRMFANAFIQIAVDEKKIRQMNNELIEKERARTLFFHNTSHELRTPLNGIIGFVGLMLGGTYGEMGKKLTVQLGKVNDLAHSLKNQVNTILDLAKSKKGELELKNSVVSLEDVFVEANILAESLCIRGQEFEFVSNKSWSDGEMPSVIADADKLQTIVRNLLGNAFKFSDPERQNRVTFNMNVFENEFEVVVSDTGIGIPKEAHGRIFKEFEQVNKETSRSYEGTGLGLAMVANTVEVMKGRISLDSEEGVGSSFHIMIPKDGEVSAVDRKGEGASTLPEDAMPYEEEVSEEEIAQVDEGQKVIEEVTEQPYTILVVDDNEVNLEVISDVLRTNGYPVEVADGGAKALEMINSNPPDLVLLDLMMPEVSGEDVLKTVRDTPEISDLPIILLTARASQEDRILGLNMGADDYLAKPIVSEEIILRVKNILSRLDLAREKTQKESMKRQNEIVGSLLELGSRMQMEDDIDIFLEDVLNKLNELFDDRSFGLVIEGARPKIIKHVAFSGLTKEEKDSILSVQHKISAGDSKYASSFSDSPEISSSDKDEIQKLLISPGEQNEWTLLGGDIQGGNSDDEITHRLKLFMKGTAMTDASLNTIKVFIDQVIGASRNKLLTSKLDRLANSDALTGAYNRAFFDVALKHEIELNLSSEHINFSILMCDINGLKEINDKFGHEGGDVLIRKCYDVLVKSCRETDMIIRLGGDEFLVLSPATSADDAQMILKRIRDVESQTKVEIKDEESGDQIQRNVSMSIGVASTSDTAPDEVLKIADKEMYADKDEFYKTHERYR